MQLRFNVVSFDIYILEAREISRELGYMGESWGGS